MRISPSALLAALVLSVSPLPPLAPPAPRAAEPQHATLYAVAFARLFRGPPERDFVLLPSSARRGITLRARRGSGEARVATLAITQEVAARLAREGYRGVRGVRSEVRASPFLQLVLGELRFEPPTEPNFARLAIGVVGSGAASEVLDFLLRREPDGWRVLTMRIRGTS